MGCATCHWNEFLNSKIRDKKLRERWGVQHAIGMNSLIQNSGQKTS